MSLLGGCGLGILASPASCIAGTAVGTAVGGVANNIFAGIAKYFASAADSAVTWLWAQISAASTVSLNTGPGAHTFEVYIGLVAGIATLVAFALFLAEIIGSVLRQDARGLAKAVSGLAVAFLGTAIAIAITVALLDAVDALSNGVLQIATGQDMSHLGEALLAGGIEAAVTNPAAVLLFALVVIVAVVIVWAALTVRKLLVIIAAVFAPLAFAGATNQLTSSWVRRWIESTLALIASKLILVFVFIIGYGILLGGLGEPADPTGTQKVTNLAVGVLTLAMAGLSPWVALKTVHFAGTHFDALHAQAGHATAGASTAASIASAPPKLARHLTSPAGAGGGPAGTPSQRNSGTGSAGQGPAGTGSAGQAKVASPPPPTTAGPVGAGVAAAASASQAARKAATVAAHPSSGQP